MSRGRDDRNGGGNGTGEWPLDCKVYVGGLPADASAAELEDIFGRFGRLRKVWVARRPPGFAFLEYDDARDAEDACRALDGTRMCGVRARVEMSSGRRRNRGGAPSRDGGGRGGGREGGRDREGRDGSYRSGGRGGRSPPPRRAASRSRSRSPKRSRSRSRSGGNAANSRSRSRSRSRS